MRSIIEIAMEEVYGVNLAHELKKVKTREGDPMTIEPKDKILFTEGEYSVYESPEGYLIGQTANGVVEVTIHIHGPRSDLSLRAEAQKQALAALIVNHMGNHIKKEGGG